MVRLDGTVVEGDLAELSDEMVTAHLAVYRTRPQAGAVIETHSLNLLALPSKAVHRRCGMSRCVAGPGAGGPGGPGPASVADTVVEPTGTQAVLLAGHGVLAFGVDTEAAVTLLVTLEEAAQAELRADARPSAGWLRAPFGPEHCTCGGWRPGAGVSRWWGDPSARETITMMPTDVPARPLRGLPGRSRLLPLGDWLRRHALRSWPVLAVDRDHSGQRGLVPRLREGRVPRRPARPG